MTGATDCAAERSPAGSAAGPDAWDRPPIAWAVAFYLFLAVAAAAALTASPDELSDGERIRAVVFLALLGGWYAAVGTKAVRGRSFRVGVLYLAGMIPLFLAAFAQDGTVGFLLFVLYPQTWSLGRSTRLAVTANVVLSIGVGLTVLLALDGSPIEAAVQSAVSLGFSLLMGLWVTGIVRQSVGRRAVIAELERTRAELAAANREAGMLAERERLAREIHDTLAQGFTSVLMLVELAESEVDSQPAAARRRLGEARETARQNLAEARSLVAALAPADLQAASLPQAVGRLVERFGRERGTPATLAVGGEPRALPANHEVVLLRAAQEAVANVRKHAGPARVTVELDYRPDGTTLVVTDDGTGFGPEPAPGGFGLAGMRRRVEEVGGTLDVLGRPGAGTTLRVTLP